MQAVTGLAVGPSTAGVRACPACSEPLAPESERADCSGCGASHPVGNGIPVLLAASGAQEQRQATHFDESRLSVQAVRRPENA